MPTSPRIRDNHTRYVWLCESLLRHGEAFFTGRRSHASRRDEVNKLGRDLVLARIALRPEQVLAAGNTLAALLSAVALIAEAVLYLASGTQYILPGLALAATIPIIGRHALVTFPAKAASKRADRVMRDSAEATNLMIMCLRHEPSISKAVTLASRCEGEFPQELRSCLWRVVMGKHESFEEALTSLGERWSRWGSELKTSLNAMVTASRESTQDGRRRALDRANQAMISGAKRRIEDYALSLSAPSMVIFGVGILLPLMVGSFLPMLSWNLWSLENASASATIAGDGQAVPQMVFVMNVLFPAIALLVALNAISNHPLELAEKATRNRKPLPVGMAAVIVASATGSVLAWHSLHGMLESVSLLASWTAPISIWLLVCGRARDRTSTTLSEDLEQVLFKTGGRMLEGENFEASFHRATREAGEGRSDTARRLSFGSVYSGKGLPQDAELRLPSFGVRNALQGLRITQEAASKDESAAGILAMDLAAYLKDLRDLEHALRNRLRPIMSMMKTTALLLAPIVLGVTYAIYMSLGSMMGNGAGAHEDGLFFLVLGVFLAQMNAVVVYFMWGIDGKAGFGRLARSLGGCLMISELTYASTAVIASL